MYGDADLDAQPRAIDFGTMELPCGEGNIAFHLTPMFRYDTASAASSWVAPFWLVHGVEGDATMQVTNKSFDIKIGTSYSQKITVECLTNRKVLDAGAMLTRPKLVTA